MAGEGEGCLESGRPDEVFHLWKERGANDRERRAHAGYVLLGCSITGKDDLRLWGERTTFWKRTHYLLGRDFLDKKISSLGGETLQSSRMRRGEAGSTNGG